ncbi:uncharacterized protein [Eucyclogobius newberryi]|uniref:uncharacterized protein n=1 Tax=Eucyclogobius newberryi TaxID=166745 RepID=UPI003B592F1C
MLTVKGKGNSPGHRYTPVSEFDNATLAQKREYWRNKKREQRARRSEKRRTTPKPNSLAVSPFPLQNKNGSNQAVNNADSLQIKTRTSSSFAALHCQKQQLPHNPSPIRRKIAVKCIPLENMTVNSVLLNSSTSVPPFTKSHSAQPCVSVQDSPVPKTNQNPPVQVFILPKPTTNIAVVSSPSSTKSTPQLATKSALVIQQKPAHMSPAKAETEDEKAAKRRELWRIRKREQRAKLAAGLGKNRAQNVQRPQSSNGASIHVPSQSLIQPGFMVKTEHLQTNMETSFQSAPPLGVVKRPFESFRKTLSPFHLSGVMRPRCPTPRQNVIKQKLLKLNSPSISYIYGSKRPPQINPSDTPEQVIAKRRENWRLKKREQRAKLSVDVKLRLKEKDDFQRRVKRYHKILEDMRKARSQSIMHASETIGGFIKEDGTFTINIPQVTVNFGMPAHKRDEVDNNDACPTQLQTTSKHLQPLLSHSVPVNCSVSPMGPQTDNSHHQILTDAFQNIACSSSQIVPSRTQGPQLMLTPASSVSTGSTTGGCVMKMAVSCKASSCVKAYLDPSLTEEERMAKRREYWRVKKREQRAARSVWPRQGHSQARASAVLLKRRAQKHVAAVPLGKRHPRLSGSITNHNMAYVNEMKEVSVLMPAVDLNLNQAICPELKPPMSRTPPPAQVYPDPALSADNQATTLLAVASMKKLLEESLSSVSEYQPETGIKIETEEENVEQDVKPDVLLDNVCAPITAHVMVQTQSSHADTKLEHVSFEQKDMSLITPSLIPHCAPDNTPETLPFIVNPKVEASDCVQLRTQHTKQAEYQHCCSPGPPKLHHPPIETQAETEDENYNRDKCPQVMTLEQKREYWKLMKRQQRARLKARQRSISNVASFRTVQSSGCILNKRTAIKPVLLPKPSTESGTAVTSMPTVLLVSPTVADAGPQGTLRVKSPVCSRDRDTRCRRGDENTTVKRSVFPTIKPPDNPLSNMNIQPIEPSLSKLRSITIPCQPKKNNVQYVASRSIGTIVPPKPIPGESEEDFQKRKREYWRVKKKEQRARKAFQDKDKDTDPSCSQNLPQYMPPEPLQDQCEQESNEWMDPVEPEDLINDSTDCDVGSFTFPSYTVPIDSVFTDYESPSGEEAALSGDFWRNNYLMDHDPLNQLLVCMVCGELQYVHSLEGVRGHIEEAHPHTLNLDSGERHRILQAWDEQVFHRERFFTNQLQQHSASMTEAHMN